MDHKVVCTVCRKRIFDDYRYKCLVCDSYDLCSECFEGEKSSHNHSKGHPVVRYTEPNFLFNKPNRNDSDVTLANLEREYSGAKHEDFQCNSCGLSPIKGLRFSSYNRKNYDLCLNCFKRRPNNNLIVVHGTTPSLDINQDDLELISELGKGAFGAVFKAKLKSKNMIVACKFIEYEFHGGQDPGQIESFQREVAAYSEIQAKNILRMIGYSRVVKANKKFLVLVTEFMGKGSLSALLARQPDLSLRRRFTLACHIARGMQKMHQLNYIHRDIRPDNILIDENFVAKIGDMGIARELSESYRNMTHLGCQPYMPMEFFIGPFDQKLDIFTFGLTINELFGGSHHQKFVLGEKIKELASFFQDLIRSCTDKVPANRPTAQRIYSQLKDQQIRLNQHFASREDEYDKMSVENKNKMFLAMCHELSIG